MIFFEVLKNFQNMTEFQHYDVLDNLNLREDFS
jgi:hypothetical protein